MASLVKHESDNKTHFHVAFRYAGKRFLRSLRTTDEKEARKHLANIKDTLKDALAPTSANRSRLRSPLWIASPKERGLNFTALTWPSGKMERSMSP
jgi:hypothetical protein